MERINEEMGKAGLVWKQIYKLSYNKGEFSEYDSKIVALGEKEAWREIVFTSISDTDIIDYRRMYNYLGVPYNSLILYDKFYKNAEMMYIGKKKSSYNDGIILNLYTSEEEVCSFEEIKKEKWYKEYKMLKAFNPRKAEDFLYEKYKKITDEEKKKISENGRLLMLIDRVVGIVKEVDEKKQMGGISVPKNGIKNIINEQIKVVGLQWLTNETDFSFMKAMKSQTLKRQLITKELGSLAIFDAKKAKKYLGIEKGKELFDFKEKYEDTTIHYIADENADTGQMQLKCYHYSSVAINEESEGDGVHKKFKLIKTYNEKAATAFINEECKKEWEREMELWHNHPVVIQLLDDIIEQLKIN